jgi:hypothetical protein
VHRIGGVASFLLGEEILGFTQSIVELVISEQNSMLKMRSVASTHVATA